MKGFNNMKIFALVLLLLLGGCRDKCATRQDCLKGHYETTLMVLPTTDGGIMLIPIQDWHCDEWGPKYKPEGCK